MGTIMGREQVQAFPEKNQRGVSLIESMTALLIFMFGVMGWLSLEMGMSGESLETQARSEATFIANSIADSLRQIPYDNVQNPTLPLYFDQTGKPTAGESIFTASWDVVTVTDEVNPVLTFKAVAIVVTWKTRKDGVESSLDLNFERVP